MDRKDNSSSSSGPPGKGRKLPAARKSLFLKQKNMQRMVVALSPLAVTAVYFFGWRSAAVLAAVFAAGLATEYLMEKRAGKPISTACLVTCMLYGLSLPPTVPFFVAVVGIVVAILFGKEVFGGFGRNFANPAIVGRAFVYVCFPVPLTARFVPAFEGFPGGFARWSFESMKSLPARLAGAGREVADAVSQASPMWVNKRFGDAASYEGHSLWNMLLGDIGGLFQAGGETRILSAGSMGEGCALLIGLAAIYLLVTKTANWRLMLSGFVGLAAATFLFRNLLGFDDLAAAGQHRFVVPPLHFTLLAGTTAYAAVFMITDPVSAPKRPPAQLAYGFLIGFLIVLLRWRGVFVAAASFSILLVNLVGPLLDMGADAWKARRKASTAKAAGGSA